MVIKVHYLYWVCSMYDIRLKAFYSLVYVVALTNDWRLLVNLWSWDIYTNRIPSKTNHLALSALKYTYDKCQLSGNNSLMVGLAYFSDTVTYHGNDVLEILYF
jgi:hypothetical protein